MTTFAALSFREVWAFLRVPTLFLLNEEMKMICIYAIINIVDDKHYVGQASDKILRWREHRKSLRGFYHHSILLQRAWCKHGEANFIFVVLEILSDVSQLNEREVYWGNLLTPEYNMAPLGGTMRGYKHTDEARANMAKSHIGKKHHSEEEKQKRSERMKGNTFAAGQKHTAERIEARAVLHRGKPKSAEHIAKIAASNKGKVRSAETRKRQSEAARNKPPVSEETRKKLSEAAKRQWAAVDRI